jgi:hypothetical protein
MVSARRATDPVAKTITTWNRAVAIRTTSEILTARMPLADDTRAESIESAAS